MRSIYASHSYNSTAKTVRQKVSLVHKMRHFSHIAAREYFRITDTTTNKDEDATMKQLKAEIEN